VYPSLEDVAAVAVPGYRYAHDYISDLGRPDSPLGPLMNTAFVVQGLLFLAGAVLLARATPINGSGILFVGCAGANAVGNIVVAIVPSGPAGIPWLHVAILAGPPFVTAAGASRYYRAASIGLATLGLLSFVLLAIASTTSVTTVLPGAVWERTSVYTIIAWQVLSSLQLLVRPTE
jgi:hypothetical membrane protein